MGDYSKEGRVLAILSIIFGIVSWPLDFMCGIGVLFAITAVVLGCASKAQSEALRHVSTLGIIFGSLGIVIPLLCIGIIYGLSTNAGQKLADVLIDFMFF